ncbi:hypothetical protein Clo1100_0081 [Clostridium sp. BNL1100]|nr:hypothetical protein Clo1100_0081 [Clostridium sp. BNL1100]
MGKPLNYTYFHMGGYYSHGTKGWDNRKHRGTCFGG